MWAVQVYGGILYLAQDLGTARRYSEYLYPPPLLYVRALGQGCMSFWDRHIGVSETRGP